MVHCYRLVAVSPSQKATRPLEAAGIHSATSKEQLHPHWPPDRIDTQGSIRRFFEMLTGLADEFDEVLNLESTFQAEGRQEASAAGAASGLQEGRTMGWKAGVALTTELEFYHGAASALLALSKAFEDQVPERAVTIATRLVETCQATPLSLRGNDSQLDMDALADKARGMFRQMAAFAGLPGLRFDLGSRSLLADLSF